MGKGRPLKPEAERQRHSVTCKLTDAELKRLQTAAGREPLGTFLRRVLLERLAQMERRRK